MSQSPQGKAWLHLCSEDMRFATPWLTNGLVWARANDKQSAKTYFRQATERRVSVCVNVNIKQPQHIHQL